MATEKRLIVVSDWDSFYADMRYSHNTMDSYEMGYTDALDRVDDWMDAQPTVDTVEVVPCKNCKYIESDGCGSIYCQKWDRWEMPEDGYCYLGERKIDG